MKRRLVSALAVLLLLGCTAVPSFAYFNRGNVTLTLGQRELSMNVGSTASVSVGISPIKEQQLPGCGMAECPQTCGDTGCLNENGECTCGGLEYETYYASVTAVSADPSVAAAEYQNGTLTVRGMSEGSTVITVKGSMRQYTDAEQVLSVTVNAAPVQNSDGAGSGGYTAAPFPSSSPSYTNTNNAGNSSAGGSAYAGNSYSQANNGSANYGGNGQTVSPDNPALPEAAAGDGGVLVTPVEDNYLPPEQTAQEPAGTEETGAPSGVAAGDDGSRIVNTKRGVFEMVPLTESTDIQAHLQAAIDGQRYVTFQKKDGDNVIYSWTFNGKELREPFSVNLMGTVEPDIPEGMRSKVRADRGMALLFSQSDPLPVQSDLYTSVSAVFEDGERLQAVRADESHEGEVIAEDIPVENGYAAFKTDYCGPMILTVKKKNNWIPWAVGSVAAAAAAAGAAWGLHNRGRRGKA